MNKGIIVGFRGSWSSGIAELVIRDEKGSVKAIPCENTSTVRALEACYGGVIGTGRTANQKPFVGKKIFYEYGEWGLLGVFIPACDFCGDNPAVDALDGEYICEKCVR
jgi:hypothetical protein